MNLNMADMFGRLQKMQDDMKQLRDSLNDITVEAEAGGGMVRVTANANKRILQIQIDWAALGDDREMLEDLTAAAVNKALDKAEERSREEMGKLTNGMLPNIPGMDLSRFGL